MALPRPILLLIVLLFTFIALDSLGHRKLANPDEGRYSEISREMAASGDWVTPRLNGLKYFEKPPMQYWATALAFTVFGESDSSARLWTAVCCLLSVLLVAYTGWRLFSPEAGALAALALVGSPYFMALSEIVTLDMGLTFFTTLSVCAFLLSRREHDQAGTHPARFWMLLAWAGIAGATLSKGLIGIVFPGVALFLYCAIQRDFRLLLRLEWGWGLLLFFSLAAPWFILVSQRNPEFAQFFFIHEHFTRFLTTEHRRSEPWWFFIPILFLGVLPWAFMLLSAARRAWQSEAQNSGFRALRFALIWTGFIVIFFSLSGSKLPAYLLPVFPPLALVIGCYLLETPERRLAWYVAPGILLGLIGAVASWTAPERAKDALTSALYDEFRIWLIAASLIFSAATLFAFLLLRNNRRLPAVLAIAVGTLLLVEVVERGYETISPLQSGFAVAQSMKPHIGPDTRIYSVSMYDQTLPFYLKRTLTLVRYVDEFALGIEMEPQLAIENFDAFEKDWMRQQSALAIMQERNYRLLRERGLPMQIIHQDPRRVVVKKP
jgi:4-amino-4-deoxy-L-arabinose transferase-like glycosyltransferase